MRRLSAIRDLVFTNLDLAFARQAKYYDEHHRPVRYEVADKVLRKNHKLSKASEHIASKLTDTWRGECYVTKKISDVMYEVVDVESHSKHKLHVSEMKPWNDRPVSSYVSEPPETELSTEQEDPEESLSVPELIPQPTKDEAFPEEEKVEDGLEDGRMEEPEPNQGGRRRKPPDRFEPARGRPSVRGRGRPRGRKKRGRPPRIN